MRKITENKRAADVLKRKIGGIALSGLTLGSVATMAAKPTAIAVLTALVAACAQSNSPIPDDETPPPPPAAQREWTLTLMGKNVTVVDERASTTPALDSNDFSTKYTGGFIGLLQNTIFPNLDPTDPATASGIALTTVTGRGLVIVVVDTAIDSQVVDNKTIRFGKGFLADNDEMAIGSEFMDAVMSPEMAMLLRGRSVRLAVAGKAVAPFDPRMPKLVAGFTGTKPVYSKANIAAANRHAMIAASKYAHVRNA